VEEGFLLDYKGPKRIEKGRPAVLPNLADYDAAVRSFRWEEARALISGLPSGALNIAYEAVDRHAEGPLADHLAIRWLGKTTTHNLTFADLRRETNRFANVLRQLGIARGGRVFLLTGRIPELYVAVLGTLKAGGVVCPLFSAFGPEPVRARMEIGAAEVLVTTPALYAKKVAPIRAS
jgi:acetyl-CoA synthetase